MDINEKIYRNVKTLAKINDIDMRDIESQLGNSAGYLSRKNTKISVETLLKLADILEVSTDELMRGDFEQELNQKNAIGNLRAAVLEACKYFNSTEILIFVKDVFPPEGGED